MVRGWPGLRVADAPAIERHSLDQRIELLALGELQVDARAPGDPGYERGRADTELGLDDRTARIGDRDQRSSQYIDDAHAFRASQRQRYVACANAHADAFAEQRFDVRHDQLAAGQSQRRQSMFRIERRDDGVDDRPRLAAARLRE